MKQHPNTPAVRAKRMLALGMAAMLTSQSAFAQTTDADALRRLQEENAALRRQLAEAQGRSQTAPVTSTATSSSAPVTTSPTATSSEPQTSDPDTMVLSPFEVRSEKDYGYLRTNSMSATRIGTEIQKVPLNISVLSEDFVKDTGATDIADVLRYVASSAGDTKMGLLQPATGATPSGNISLRGFPINSRLRNGLVRYNGYNLDTVERVEIIQGPAAVFFGQGYPGGVINYVTKKPQFANIPTTFSYAYGGSGEIMGSQRVTMDHNVQLGKKAAFRVVGAWDNKKGDADWEYQQGHTFAPSLTLNPLDSGKLRINLEMESSFRQRNLDDSAWIWQDQYFKDYAAPTQALINAAGTAVSGAADPVAAYRNRIFSNYGAWIADVRTVAGNQALPAYTSIQRGAYYTNLQGQRIHDEEFNYYGRGSKSEDKNNTFQATVEFSPTEWLDTRYAFTSDRSWYYESRSQAIPNADGITFNFLNSMNTRDYMLNSHDHQLDLVFKKKLAKLDNKLLVGGVLRTTEQAYTGTSAVNLAGTGQFPFFANLPGAYSKPDEGYVSPIPTNMISNFTTATQYVRDRNGKILNPIEIFTKYDPSVNPNPDYGRISEVSRGLIDKYKPKRKDFYINYQGSALEDRLHIFGGWRHEELLANGGQMVDANGPWYSGFGDMVNQIPMSNWGPYGLSNYSVYQLLNYKSDSYMAGLAYEVIKGVTVYASWSQTGVFNTGTLGGDYDEVSVRSRATAIGLNPDTEMARLASQGGRQLFKPEKGLNYEVGTKVSLNDNKIVGTLSFFKGRRENRKLDDTQRTTDEVLNYLGPNKSGGFNRLVRWYNNDAIQEVQGVEAEVIWTPVRNYQIVANGAWLYTAKTVSDISILPTAVNRPIVFNNRLPFAPEFRFNLFNKYTFNSGVVRGLSVGGGVRASSEIIIANDTNYNATLGGATAGDYITFDGLVSYPWEVLGYKLNTSLSIQNLADKDYSEGNANLSARRSWWLTTTLSF